MSYIAGLLGDLDDEEVRLVNEQADLMRRSQDIESRLARIAEARKALLTDPPPSRRPDATPVKAPATPARRGRPAAEPPTDINERRRSKERALEFARSYNGDGFTAADLAHAWGIENAQVTFPVLNALARDGQLVRVGSKPTRFQVAVAA